jgi:UDP-glucose 4-epimerase
MTSKKTSVLITGIAGSIGQAVASRLVRDSHRVVGLDVAGLPSNMAGLVSTHNVGSIADNDFLDRALTEADAVVHLAGWVHAVPRNEQEKRKVFSLNHEATGEIARICEQSDKRLVFASTVAVYGDAAAGRLSEDSPARPSTAYGESKLLAERHVLDAGGTVLRLPMVYGAHDRGNMARMIRAIRKRRFVVPGEGKAPRTFAGRWNVAEAIACALENDEARGRTFLVTDDEDTTLAELCDLIAELAGCGRPLRVPSAIVAGAALTGSALKRLLKRGMPVDWSSYRKLARELSFDGSRIREVLGYRPAKSLRDGLEEEVSWLVERDA